MVVVFVGLTNSVKGDEGEAEAHRNLSFFFYLTEIGIDIGTPTMQQLIGAASCFSRVVNVWK